MKSCTYCFGILAHDRLLRAECSAPMSRADARQAMIEEFDIDGDGEINLDEFLAIMLDGE